MIAAGPVRATHASPQPSPLRLALIAAALLLAGCATPHETIRRVEIPVAVPCPALTLPPRPHIPLADLPPDATDADIARATAASLEAFFGYAQTLVLLIEPATSRPAPTQHRGSGAPAANPPLPIRPEGGPPTQPTPRD